MDAAKLSLILRLGRSNFALRLAKPNDETFQLHLFASARETQLAPLAAVMPPAQFQALLSSQYQAQLSHINRHFPEAIHAIILGRELGMAEGYPMGRIILDWQPSGCHIADITILSTWRNRGIGSALLKAIQIEAAELNRRVTLQVDLMNPARNLYLRAGFEEKHRNQTHSFMQWEALRSSIQPNG